MSEESDEETHIKIKNTAVPIVITESMVYRKKKIKRRRFFRGPLKGFSRLCTALGNIAMDLIEESFFEESIEVLDPGEVEEHHYAIMIDNNADGNLVAEPMDVKPPCIHHYEIIRDVEEEALKLAKLGLRSARSGQLTKRGHREQNPHAQKLRAQNEEVRDSVRRRLEQEKQDAADDIAFQNYRNAGSRRDVEELTADPKFIDDVALLEDENDEVEE